MTPEFARAQLLRTHHRYEEAVALLYQHLAQYPEDPDAFIELALNRTAIPGAEKLALADARTACGLAPDRPFPMSLQARILSSMNQPQDALRLADGAIALEPSLAYYWNTKSIVLCDMGHWKVAEAAARQALSLDPDDGTASNLLSLALRRQNKLYASEEESRRRLKRDPESAFAFYNLGLAALRRHHFTTAESYFLESLRIDPTLQHVRQGLKDTLLRRRFFFRWSLAYLGAFRNVLWPRRGRMVTIGMFFSAFAGFGLWEMPWWTAWPVSSVAYLTLGSPWLFRPLTEIPLWITPQGQSLSEEPAIRESRRVLWVLSGVWMLAGMGFGLRSLPLLALSAGTALGLLPWMRVRGNGSRAGRYFFGTAGTVIFLCGCLEAAGRTLQWRDARGETLDAVWIAPALLLLVTSVWLEFTRLYVPASQPS